MDDGLNYWRQLLSQESELRTELARLSQVAEDASTHDHKYRKQTLQTWWGSIEAILIFYRSALARGEIVLPPPLDVLSALELFAGYLAVGNMPVPIYDAASKGRHSPGPTERKHLEIAVAYLHAANGGFEHRGGLIRIVDKTPVKTVADAFGVHRNTPKDWEKRVSPSVPYDLLDGGDSLLFRMKEAGEIYRIHGRSLGAIRARATRK
jgi:hypothetical protein